MSVLGCVSVCTRHAHSNRLLLDKCSIDCRVSTTAAQYSTCSHHKSIKIWQSLQAISAVLPRHMTELQWLSYNDWLILKTINRTNKNTIQGQMLATNAYIHKSPKWESCIAHFKLTKYQYLFQTELNPGLLSKMIHGFTPNKTKNHGYR